MDFDRFYKYPSEEGVMRGVWGINHDYELAKLAVKRLSSTGEPQKKFISKAIDDFQNSKQFETMETARQYLMNENVTIKNRNREVGIVGGAEQSPLLANTKLSHPFMYNLTEQKVNMLLSKEMSILSNDEDYSREVSKYMNKKFFRQLKTLGQSAIPYGIAWLQVYYDKNGELRTKHIPSHEVIPFWRDSEHRELDAVIRFYEVENIDDEGISSTQTKIEYYTHEGVWYYESTEDGLFLDGRYEQYPVGNFSLSLSSEVGDIKQVQDTDEEIEEFHVLWDNIPFIAFKYNHYEVSLLQWVRSQIDEYDIISSDMSNNIKDFPNSFKEVRGYSGEDVEEFNRNLLLYRTAFIAGDENSGMKIHTMPLDYEGVKGTLDRLRKDIYDGGKGVDPQEANFGHASGVAIRYRYLGLLQDCTAMGNEFQEGLEKLLYFINLDIKLKGGKDYEGAHIDFVFNTDAIVNETETITNIRNSLGIISDESLVAKHPWVTDAGLEYQRLMKQREDNLLYFGDENPDPNTQFGSDMTAEAFLEAEDKGTGLDLKKRG